MKSNIHKPDSGINIHTVMKKESVKDYRSYFFEKGNYEKEKMIYTKLEALPLEELNEIGIQVLQHTFAFLKGTSGFTSHSYSSVQYHAAVASVIRFHSTVVWFLSDSIDGIPRYLGDRELIDCLTRFFAFLNKLKGAEMPPLEDEMKQAYNWLTGNEEWKIIYQ